MRNLFRSERRSARKSRRVEALILSTSTAEEPVEIYTGVREANMAAVVSQVVHGLSRYLPVLALSSRWGQPHACHMRPA